MNDLAVKENDDGLILGGDMMTWDDALKIAAYSVEGESRDESYQLPHSTGITDDPDIPFYNPGNVNCFLITISSLSFSSVLISI